MGKRNWDGTPTQLGDNASVPAYCLPKWAKKQHLSFPNLLGFEHFRGTLGELTKNPKTIDVSVVLIPHPKQEEKVVLLVDSATCSRKDTWNRRLGFRIATGRVLKRMLRDDWTFSQKRYDDFSCVGGVVVVPKEEIPQEPKKLRDYLRGVIGGMGPVMLTKPVRG